MLGVIFNVRNTFNFAAHNQSTISNTSNTVSTSSHSNGEFFLLKNGLNIYFKMWVLNLNIKQYIKKMLQ